MIIEGDYINVLIDDGYRLAATRAQCRELIDEAVTELASRIYAGASAYDVAMCYHDSIIAAIDYAYGSDNLPEKELWAHNITACSERRVRFVKDMRGRSSFC